MEKQQAQIDMTVVNEIVALAKTREVPLAELPMEEIASALGMSRMTLYRKIGSREDLHLAVRALGHDPGETPDVRERVLTAAAGLIRESGVGPLTMERVAEEAGCALPTVFSTFGNRRSLLMAVFARHINVPQISSAFVEVPAGDPEALRRTVREMYATVMKTFVPELPIVRALVAEALRDPGGDAGAYIVERHLPALFEHIVPWFASMLDRGVIRDVPLPIAIQQFLGPVAAHIATQPILESQAMMLPLDQEVACDLLADQFCRALAPDKASDITEEGMQS